MKFFQDGKSGGEDVGLDWIGLGRSWLEESYIIRDLGVRWKREESKTRGTHRERERERERGSERESERERVMWISLVCVFICLWIYIDTIIDDIMNIKEVYFRI